MNEEEIKLLNKIEELPRELNIEIRGLILAEICLRKENQQLKEQLKQKEDIINKAKEYIINNSLYEEEYDYDYEENIYLSGIHDDDVRRILLEILDNKGE